MFSVSCKVLEVIRKGIVRGRVSDLRLVGTITKGFSSELVCSLTSDLTTDAELGTLRGQLYSMVEVNLPSNIAVSISVQQDGNNVLLLSVFLYDKFHYVSELEA